MQECETPTIDALVDEAFEFAEDLNRPLRYVQINSFYDGSTGAIMRNLHNGLAERNIDSYIFWGRSRETINDHEQRFATKMGCLLHGAMARLTDRAGFYSKRDTAKLLKRLDEIDPDVVHLHNLHGYYINIEMLFSWLAQHHCQVKWTLHDCWSFTGHCAHFTYVKCAQWMTHCAHLNPCPQLGTYPKTLFHSNCANNFADKQRVFTSVPPERMTFIAPSFWLEKLVRRSFLKGYPVEVRHNIVDKSVFTPTSSNFREAASVDNRFMILGVANPWSEHKGLNDFIYLANELDDRYAIVIVGLSQKQVRMIRRIIRQQSQVKRKLSLEMTLAALVEKSRIGRKRNSRMSRLELDFPVPNTIYGREGCSVILFGHTNSREQLAAIYTAADVFFNPTREDNFPTVNLEAEACGTDVITYDTGGCRETIFRPGSCVVSSYEEAMHTTDSMRSKNDN